MKTNGGRTIGDFYGFKNAFGSDASDEDLFRGGGSLDPFHELDAFLDAEQRGLGSGTANGIAGEADLIQLFDVVKDLGFVEWRLGGQTEWPAQGRCLEVSCGFFTI